MELKRRDSAEKPRVADSRQRGSMPRPPFDSSNGEQIGLFSPDPGATNTLDLGFAIQIVNRPVHHHFKPLADLLSHPSWTELSFFDNELVTGALYDSDTVNTNLLECYYLIRADGDAAIGWVHNRKASSMSNFYIKNSAPTQNFFGCEAPSATALLIPGLMPSTEYHITWFPTWANSTVCLLDTVWMSNASGELFLDLSSAPLGDTIQYFTDTLHADYAFVVTLDDFVKSRSADQPVSPIVEGWDFVVFPNPTRENVFLRFADDTPKEIVLFDISGRPVLMLAGVTSSTPHLASGELAKGPYFVRVSNGTNSRTKKLIIQ